MRVSHLLIDYAKPASSVSVSAPGATPKEATLAPPAPFSDSVTFQLGSGSFTGNFFGE
jgi:hypothetical protein